MSPSQVPPGERERERVSECGECEDGGKGDGCEAERKGEGSTYYRMELSF